MSVTPVEDRLFPAEGGARHEVERLCRRFDEELGPKGRTAPVRPHARPAQTGAGLQQRRVCLLGRTEWSATDGRSSCGFLERALGIRPGIEAEDEAAVWRELDFVVELLADGRPYLCGERFGAADLTFAALCWPRSSSLPVYGVPLPPLEVLPLRPPHRSSSVRASTPLGATRSACTPTTGGCASSDLPRLAPATRGVVLEPAEHLTGRERRHAVLGTRRERVGERQRPLLVGGAAGRCAARPAARRDLARERDAPRPAPRRWHQAVRRPIAAPRRPETPRPVRIRSSAWLCPSRRVRRIVPPSISGMPQRRQKTPKTASSAATRRSHHAASSRPPATAWPSTAAITGFGAASASGRPGRRRPARLGSRAARRARASPSGRPPRRTCRPLRSARRRRARRRRRSGGRRRRARRAVGRSIRVRHLGTVDGHEHDRPSGS